MIKLRAVLCVGVFSLGLVSTTDVVAATVVLDDTVIEFSASGSPNTITGTWSTSALILPAGATIEHFTVEITTLSSASDLGISLSSFGLTAFIPGNSSRIVFCGTGCVADAVVGDVGFIDSGTSVLFAWAFMNRLVSGADSHLSSGQTSVSYSSGGGFATASGEVLVTMYGAPIPIPAAIWLFGSALGMLGWLRCKPS